MAQHQHQPNSLQWFFSLPFYNSTFLYYLIIMLCNSCTFYTRATANSEKKLEENGNNKKVSRIIDGTMFWETKWIIGKCRLSSSTLLQSHHKIVKFANLKIRRADYTWTTSLLTTFECFWKSSISIGITNKFHFWTILFMKNRLILKQIHFAQSHLKN